MILVIFFFRRSHAISADIKLLATLRFFATGSYHTVIGDFSGISPASVTRVIRETSRAIANLRPDYIYMPRNNDELKNNFLGFYNISQMSTIVGCIDGTHVKVCGQGGPNGERFRNRKQFFSLNIQVIGNHDLKIQNIVARWPGSTHDAFIFDSSNIKSRVERGEFYPGVLLGDGGYKLETFMLTPYRNPETNEERHFNRCHIRTRNTVERLFGVWKNRFPCLAFGLRTEINTTMTVIVACAVMHNICINNHDAIPDDHNPELDQAIQQTIEANEQARNIRNNNRRAIAYRNRVADLLSARNANN